MVNKRKAHRLTVVAVVLVAVTGLLSCGIYSGAEPSAPTSAVELPTLGPAGPTTGPAATQDMLGEPIWFVEHFDAGMPSTWRTWSTWQVGPSSVAANSDGQSLFIPYRWKDLMITARLRHGGDGTANLRFLADAGSFYEVALSQNSITLGSLTPAQGQTQEVASRPIFLGDVWHDLLIAAGQGRIGVLLDGKRVLNWADANPAQTGAIAAINIGSGSLEIDRIEVAKVDWAMLDAAPEFAPPTAKPPTAQPPTKTPPPTQTPKPQVHGSDIALVGVTPNDSMVPPIGLFLDVKNNGPDTLDSDVRVVCAGPGLQRADMSQQGMPATADTTVHVFQGVGMGHFGINLIADRVNNMYPGITCQLIVLNGTDPNNSNNAFGFALP